MNTKIVIKTNQYYDSVRLMQTAEKLRREDGVEEAMLMMATDNNKRLLEIAGLLTPDASAATPNDLLIAVVAGNEALAAAAIRAAEAMLNESVGSNANLTYRTLDSAMSAAPAGNLALISVPGSYAASEARRALERGLHVMIFSDNVSLQDEVSLKQLAREKGLLLMGPDCGTAIVNGAGLGFANAVRRGPVGIVGAAGTGIQAICALVDRQGLGVSHAIGTGGRDLSPAVGGITMLDGIDLLEADPDTAVLVLVSKPPDPQVAQTVLQRAARCSKPVVVNFLGGDPAAITAAGLTAAGTLEDAALAAVRLAGGNRSTMHTAEDNVEQIAQEEAAKLAQGQKYLRGVYAGGTLCYEAMLVLQDELGAIHANIALRPELRLENPWRSVQNSCVDLGEDEFTQGRAHPMIDATLRAQRLLAEAQDPETAVLLLDIVLGYGADPDPAGSLAPALRRARAIAETAGRYLAIVASVCGTEKDPQNLQQQEQTLRDSGVIVMSSNVQASKLAGRIVRLAGHNEVRAKS